MRDDRQQLDRRESGAIIARPARSRRWSSSERTLMGGQRGGEEEEERRGKTRGAYRGMHSRRAMVYSIICANIYMNDRARPPLTIRQRRHNV